jgi:hypothetical protein
VCGKAEKNIPVATLLIGFLLCLCAHCAKGVGVQTPPEAIGEVLARETPALLSVPGVVGTGQGLCDGRPCIYVYVCAMTPEARSRIPAVLDGYRVVVKETGEIEGL